MNKAPGTGYKALTRINQLNHKFLITICSVLFTICIGNANADDCLRPGYYINANNECVQCDLNNYYCPGDDMRYACPDGGFIPQVLQPSTTIKRCIKHVGNTRLVSDLSECRGTETLCYKTSGQATHGTGSAPCYYSTKTNQYDNTGTGCVGGSILETCDAGYYASYINKTSALKDHPCNPVGAGYYSPDGDLYRYACTNAIPEHAHYGGREINETNNCEWECDTGYVKTADGKYCTSDVGNSGFCIPASFTITYICPNVGNTPATRTVSHGANFTTADASVCNGDYDVWLADDGMNTKITSNTTLPYPYFKNITLTATKR